MNNVEVQHAIDTRDWQSLLKWWGKWNNFLENKSSRITKEFIVEFLPLVKSKYPNLTLVESNDAHILESMVRSGIELTVSDYVSLYRQSLNFLFFFTKEKTSEFVEFCLTHKRDIASVWSSHAFYACDTHFSDKLIDGLNETQLVDFGNLLSANVYNVFSLRMSLSGDNSLKFIEEYVDIAALREHLYVSNLDKGIVSHILDNSTSQDIMGVIGLGRFNVLKILDNISSTNNKTFSFDDNHLKELFEETVALNNRVIVLNMMGKEQSIRLKSYFQIGDFLNAKVFSLDTVSEIFPNERNFTRIGRWVTEEDMIKHSHYFNPSYKYKSYFTRETHKLLNKTWEMRQRYDERNGSPTHVILRNIETITLENIKYLKAKGEVDWKEVMTAIQGLSPNTTLPPEIRIVRNFLNKNYTGA